MADINKMMEALELSAAAQSAIRLPLNMSEGKQVGGKWKKEILRIGEIIVDNAGRKFNFTADFLRDAKENFYKGVLDYVPMIYADKETNAHTMSARPEDYAGIMEDVELDDENNPTKLIGTFNLTEDAAKMVEHNPKFGVSVTAHPNYVDAPRGEYVGPTVLDICATHKGKLTKMDGWTKVMASNVEERFDVLDLSDYSYNITGGVEMAEQETVVKDEKIELSQEQINAAMASDAMQAAIANAVAEATKSKDAEITRLSNSIGEIQEQSYSQVVKAATSAYRGSGVPPVIVDAAEELLLSMTPEESDKVVKLSVTEGDEQKTLELSRVALITKMLDETKGFVDLGAEKGENNDPAEVKLSGDERKSAVSHLLSLANADTNGRR